MICHGNLTMEARPRRNDATLEGQSQAHELLPALLPERRHCSISSTIVKKETKKRVFLSSFHNSKLKPDGRDGRRGAQRRCALVCAVGGASFRTWHQRALKVRCEPGCELAQIVLTNVDVPAGDCKARKHLDGWLQLRYQSWASLTCLYLSDPRIRHPQSPTLHPQY